MCRKGVIKFLLYQTLTLSSYFPLNVHFVCKCISKLENYAFSELSFSCIAWQGPCVRLAIFKRKQWGVFVVITLRNFAFYLYIFLHTQSEIGSSRPDAGLAFGEGVLWLFQEH